MSKPVQISFADAWREHVLASVDWSALNQRLPADLTCAVCLCLDLYLGGTIRHDPGSGNIVCRGCLYLKENRARFEDSNTRYSACDCHVGILGAFLQGVSGRRHAVVHTIENSECWFSVHPAK